MFIRYLLCGIVVWAAIQPGAGAASELAADRFVKNSRYFADAGIWLGLAENEVVSQLRLSRETVSFTEEAMYLTGKSQAARDPVVICGAFAIRGEAEDASKRFISNGDVKGTLLDDRSKQFAGRWSSSCKTSERKAA